MALLQIMFNITKRGDIMYKDKDRYNIGDIVSVRTYRNPKGYLCFSLQSVIN